MLKIPSSSFIVTQLTLAKFDCLLSALNERFSTSIRFVPLPPFIDGCSFSSTLVVNLFVNFNAFGDKRKRNDLDKVVGGGSTIGCAFASDVILWITRTPKRTIDRRLNRSSAVSAIMEIE